MADEKRGRKRRAQPQGSTPKNGGPKWPTSADGRPKQFSIPAGLVDYFLLGSFDDRRVSQDTPLQGDVWAAFAQDPGIPRDLLIVPSEDTASVAKGIAAGRELRARDRLLERDPTPGSRPQQRAKIASLQGFVGATLYFDEVIRVVVPMTQGWVQWARRIPFIEISRLETLFGSQPYGLHTSLPDHRRFSSLERFRALAFQSI